MVTPIEVLFKQIFSKMSDKELEAKSGVGSLATLKSRYSKDGTLSISAGQWCKLARACEIDPAMALVSLMAYWIKQGKEKFDDKELSEELTESLAAFGAHLQAKPGQAVLKGPQTLGDFPDGFTGPFFVVTGDRREEDGKKMTPADFSVLSSSAADIRFLSSIGLPRGTEIITDKIFVLAPFEELSRRFADATLVVVGSPASNHCARIINRYSLHRFNLPTFYYQQLEEFIRKAWVAGTGAGRRKSGSQPKTPDHGPDFFVAPEAVPAYDYESLQDFRSENMKEIKQFKHLVFSGGFIDPSYDLRVRALNRDNDSDFGIITLAQNPFRKENDGKFPAVFMAGYHLPGTCYGLHRDIWQDRRTFFDTHPLGGILQVDLNTKLLADWPHNFFAFYERMENFVVRWDDKRGYKPEHLLEGLNAMKQGPMNCHLSPDEAARAHKFLRGLLSQGDVA
jgi:hypothetical protein